MEHENEHIIWQDEVYLDPKDYEDAYKQGLADEYVSESTDIYEFMRSEAEVNWDAEYANLDKPIDGVILASNGLWYGTREGYKPFDNLHECLHSQCNGYLKVYVDENGELITREAHHDGTNYYTFREWNEGVTDEQKEEALGDYDKTIELTHKLGDRVAKIYGWRAE